MGFVYESLYRVGLSLGARVNPKVARSLGERAGWGDRLKLATQGWSRRPIWVHVASAGELEQAIPVLEELKRQDERPILLTYFSPSAAAAVRRETARRTTVPWDLADYSPLDTAEQVGQFLAMAQPVGFVAVHRELWPGILNGCKKHNVPRFLIAAQLSRGLPWVQRRLLRDFSLVATTDEASLNTARRWVAPERCENLGDPRIRRVLDRSQLPPAPWVASLGGKSTLVAASLWPADFVATEPFLRQAVEAGWRLVLVPHEPSPKFLRRLEQWLDQLEQPYERWSQITSPPDHLVVDEVGLLQDLYRCASLVFVGGSFERKVHNVLEPAVFGCPILTGPKIQNSLEAQEMEGSGLISAANPEELMIVGHRLLHNVEERQRQGELARQYLIPRAESAQRIAYRLTSLLHKP